MPIGLRENPGHSRHNPRWGRGVPAALLAVLLCAAAPVLGAMKFGDDSGVRWPMAQGLAQHSLPFPDGTQIVSDFDIRSHAWTIGLWVYPTSDRASGGIAGIGAISQFETVTPMLELVASDGQAAALEARLWNASGEAVRVTLSDPSETPLLAPQRWTLIALAWRPSDSLSAEPGSLTLSVIGEHAPTVRSASVPFAESALRDPRAEGFTTYLWTGRDLDPAQPRSLPAVYHGLFICSSALDASAIAAAWQDRDPTGIWDHPDNYLFALVGNRDVFGTGFLGIYDPVDGDSTKLFAKDYLNSERLDNPCPSEVVGEAPIYVDPYLFGDYWLPQPLTPSSPTFTSSVHPAVAPVMRAWANGDYSGGQITVIASNRSRIVRSGVSAVEDGSLLAQDYTDGGLVAEDLKNTVGYITRPRSGPTTERFAYGGAYTSGAIAAHGTDRNTSRFGTLGGNLQSLGGGNLLRIRADTPSSWVQYWDTHAGGMDSEGRFTSTVLVLRYPGMGTISWQGAHSATGLDAGVPVGSPSTLTANPAVLITTPGSVTSSGPSSMVITGTGLPILPGMAAVWASNPADPRINVVATVAESLGSTVINFEKPWDATPSVNSPVAFGRWDFVPLHVQFSGGEQRYKGVKLSLDQPGALPALAVLVCGRMTDKPGQVVGHFGTGGQTTFFIRQRPFQRHVDTGAALDQVVLRLFQFYESTNPGRTLFLQHWNGEGSAASMDEQVRPWMEQLVIPVFGRQNSAVCLDKRMGPLPDGQNVESIHAWLINTLGPELNIPCVSAYLAMGLTRYQFVRMFQFDDDHLSAYGSQISVRIWKRGGEGSGHGGLSQAALPCTGDLNEDGAINSIDLNTLLVDFGCSGNCPGDLDDDGDTDSVDLNHFLLEMADGCP